MKIEPGQTVVVDYDKRVARETFRACGVTWVRYTHGKHGDENGYASRDEWLAWFFRQQRQPVAN